MGDGHGYEYDMYVYSCPNKRHEAHDFVPPRVQRKCYGVRDAHGEYHNVYATSVVEEGNAIKFYDSTQPEGRTLVGYFTAPISVK